MTILEIIKKDGLLLRAIEAQTPEICQAAVEQNPKALQYVRIPFTYNQ